MEPSRPVRGEVPSSHDHCHTKGTSLEMWASSAHALRRLRQLREPYRPWARGAKWPWPERVEQRNPATLGMKPFCRCAPRIHYEHALQSLHLAPTPRRLREGDYERTPLGLWLQPNGCCNSSTWVATEFTSSGFMFLKRG